MEKEKHKIRVLVVDDISQVRLAISNLINSERDMEVVGIANNGKEAINEYDRLLPDIMTTCVCMPEMNGLDASELIIKKHPKANIIIISVMTEPEYMRRAVFIGVKDYFQKPVDKDSLITTIRQLMNIEEGVVEKVVLSPKITVIDPKAVPPNKIDSKQNDLNDFGLPRITSKDIERWKKKKKKDHPDYVSLYHGPTVKWSTYLWLKRKDHEQDMTILGIFIFIILCFLVLSISQ
jgi:two-component system, chemotaxis family, chemotaxis protein CheY